MGRITQNTSKHCYSIAIFLMSLFKINQVYNSKEIFINSNAKLIAYKISYSLALQWKSVNSNIIEIKKVNINDAFNLAQQALESCVNVFGEKNIATAKIYRLIGSIFYYMERFEEFFCFIVLNISMHKINKLKNQRQ